MERSTAPAGPRDGVGDNFDWSRRAASSGTPPSCSSGWACWPSCSHWSIDERAERGAMSGWEKSAVSLAVFAPAFGGLVISLMPRSQDRLIRGLGILFTGVALGIGIVMLFGFDYGSHPGLQFELNASWIS